MILQEQLRPQSWEELRGLDQEYVKGVSEKERLISLFREDRAQVVIFAGPSGTGKTSAALLCAKDYLGDNMRLCVRTNASDERGIKMPRKIRDEANRRSKELRMVYILDEFDGTLKPTQKAFNAIIEENSDRAVFILIVNDLRRVIPALISRATVFKFPPLRREITLTWIQETAKKLSTTLYAGVAEKLVHYYNGDLRRIINDFFTKYEGLEIRDWSSPPTYGEEIYNAAKPYEKYIQLRKENYIDPIELLKELFVINKYQSPQLFAVASNNILNGGAELINVALAMEGIIK